MTVSHFHRIPEGFAWNGPQISSHSNPTRQGHLPQTRKERKTGRIPLPLKYFPAFPSNFPRKSKLNLRFPLEMNFLGRAGGGGVMGTLWEVGIREVPCDSSLIKELDDKEQEILLRCLDPKQKLQAEIHLSSFHLDFPFSHSHGIFDKEFQLTKTTDVFFQGRIICMS